MLIACKAMENATRQLISITSQHAYHLVLSLTTMNHKRQTCLYRPLHLTLKSPKLLFLKLARPIIIYSHLAYSYKRMTGLQTLVHLIKHTAPISLYFFGMQTNHRIGIAGKAIAGFYHRIDRLKVDSRHKHLAHPSLTSSIDNLMQVGSKLHILFSPLR